MRALLPATRWRLLVSPAADGPTNMALDHTLLRHVQRTSEGVLRTYAWTPASLSFGRNQRAAGLFDPVRAGARGITVIRRPTGGRAILHARECTFSLVAPVLASVSVSRVAAATADWLRGALAVLGADVDLATRPARHAAPGASPCFAEPARGELVWHDRKLAGMAQWRDGGVLLQQGSILVDDDQSSLSELSLVPAPALPPPATLREAIGRAPNAGELTTALAETFGHLTGMRLDWIDPADPVAQPRPDLVRLYHDDRWTWRR